VKLLETFDTDKHHLIVMELCPGGDLLNYVRKRRKLSEKYAKFVFKQIMEGIAYLHDNGVVHRDIKPDNILMNNDYSSVALTDFGMAADVATTPTNICGTLAYVSPEAQRAACQRDFESYIDWKKSDVFSLGVTFYTVSEFDFLFYMRKDDESISPSQKYIDRQIDKTKCSDELKDLLKKMICVDPKERISMADVALHSYLQ
jgi:serine/threonine protein kinase